MTEPITREEMRAVIEVQSKNTEQMLAVVKSLERIIETQNHISILQEKLVEKLSNGIKKEIAHEVTIELTSVLSPTISDVHKTCELLQERTPTIMKISTDIDRVKWFVGIVGLVVVVSTVILRGIDMRVITNNQIEQIKQEQILLLDVKKHLQEVDQGLIK